MNTLLIKIGKAWSVIRRDGVVCGGRRILEAIWSLLPRHLSGDILIITSGVGDSARYRGKHVAEMLRLKGFRVAVTTQDNPLLSWYAASFSVFVFHRTLFEGGVRRIYEKAKSLGKTLVFETDDLVYDSEYITKTDHYRQMNVLEQRLYKNGVGGEILADPYVKVATTTTSFLAAKLRENGKEVFIVPNRLTEEDIRFADEALQNRRTSTEGTVRVGYLSGTPSHNKDFATITPALMTLFEIYPTMQLVLAGPLDTESALNQYADRIERLPFVPRRELFGNIASLDINLAPLEIGNPFCEAKSELKFFEAGIVAVPTVAAATGTFKEAITDGVDGFVAATTEEWVEKIGRLIADHELRKTIGRAAHETAFQRYTTKNASNEAYYAYLRSRIE